MLLSVKTATFLPRIPPHNITSRRITCMCNMYVRVALGWCAIHRIVTHTHSTAIPRTASPSSIRSTLDGIAHLVLLPLYLHGYVLLLCVLHTVLTYWATHGEVGAQPTTLTLCLWRKKNNHWLALVHLSRTQENLKPFSRINGEALLRLHFSVSPFVSCTVYLNHFPERVVKLYCAYFVYALAFVRLSRTQCTSTICSNKW